MYRSLISNLPRTDYNAREGRCAFGGKHEDTTTRKLKYYRKSIGRHARFVDGKMQSKPTQRLSTLTALSQGQSNIPLQ
jgi:hypothetical protein